MIGSVSAVIAYFVIRLHFYFNSSTATGLTVRLSRWLRIVGCRCGRHYLLLFILLAPFSVRFVSASVLMCI